VRARKRERFTERREAALLSHHISRVYGVRGKERQTRRAESIGGDDDVGGGGGGDAEGKEGREEQGDARGGKGSRGGA